MPLPPLVRMCELAEALATAQRLNSSAQMEWLTSMLVRIVARKSEVH
jgi:hypothetical protein